MGSSLSSTVDALKADGNQEKPGGLLSRGLPAGHQTIQTDVFLDRLWTGNSIKVTQRLKVPHRRGFGNDGRLEAMQEMKKVKNGGMKTMGNVDYCFQSPGFSNNL